MRFHKNFQKFFLKSVKFYVIILYLYKIIYLKFKVIIKNSGEKRDKNRTK